MTAFYRSDAGRDLLAHQTAIASDTMAALQPMMRDMVAKAKAMAEQAQKAKQPTAPAAPERQRKKVFWCFASDKKRFFFDYLFAIAS